MQTRPPVSSASDAQFVLTVPAAPAPAVRQRMRRHPAVLWLIAVGLLVNAAVMLGRGAVPDIVLDRTALAQATVASPQGQVLGARGIFMMPAQLGPNAWGLYLMDVDSGTICVYRTLPETNHFRLMAARSFRYDRFLEDLNNEPLRPKEVQRLIEDQRMRQELLEMGQQPTVPQQPRPDENLPDTPQPEGT